MTTSSNASLASDMYTDVPEPQIPNGWRLKTALASVYVGLFLSFIDTTIVAVAIPTIATEFDDFARSTWLVTAYLLTYMSFGIIMARLSDLFGRKTIEIFSLVLFMSCSITCALSRSMLELIVSRALQGIGGSGLYSMTMIIAPNAVGRRKMPMMAALVSVVQVVSGPCLGGAIAHDKNSSTWRWIFWMNLPIGGLALLGLCATLPPDKDKRKFVGEQFASIDFLGAALLLTFSILLVFALQQAGTFVYAWDSPAVIASLTTSGTALAGFWLWEEVLANRPNLKVQGIFPIEIAKTRAMAATIL